MKFCYLWWHGLISGKLCYVKKPKNNKYCKESLIVWNSKVQKLKIKFIEAKNRKVRLTWGLGWGELGEIGISI